MSLQYTTIGRALQIPVFLGAVLVISWVLVAQTGMSGLYWIPMTFFLLLLMMNPAAMVVLLPLMHLSLLKLPGMTSMFRVDYLLTMLMGAWGIPWLVLMRPRTENQPWLKTLPSQRWLMLFLINMVLTMAVRGFGLRVTGGTEYGGTSYIVLGGIIMAYFFAPRIPIEVKHCRIIVFASVLAGLLPFMVEVLLVKQIPLGEWLSEYVGIKADYLADVFDQGGTAISRYTGGRWFGGALIMAGLVLPPGPGLRNPLRWVLVIGGMMAVMASGFRWYFVFYAGVLIIWLYRQSRSKPMFFPTLAVLALLGWILLYFTVEYMPLGFQRTVSYLPGLKVDPVVVLRAENSAMWRVEVWKKCIEELPQFLLVGRGLVTDVTGFAWLRELHYAGAEFGYAMHNYHSGIFSLLMDFGLAGFVTGTLFFVHLTKEVRRGLPVVQQAYGAHHWVSRMYEYLMVFVVMHVVSYYLVFGDLRSSILRIATWGIVAHCMVCMARRKMMFVPAPAVVVEQGPRPAAVPVLKAMPV